LTLRAKECIEKADVVIYDYLANVVFLAYARKDAERIYVGKEGGRHTLGQNEINRLIVEKATQGLTVVRLKGGDPLSSAGEEKKLRNWSSQASRLKWCPVSPLRSQCRRTPDSVDHRDFTATVAFVTGHEDPTKETSNIAWDKIATGAGTLVFLMGVGNLSKIAASLVEHGRSPDTPVAVIRSGTVPGQRTVTGSLGNIADLAQKEQIKPPAIIVVGDVVSLRKDLNWFERKPLFGKRIVVTRAREQASDFVARLSELGAECIEFPTIEVIPPPSWKELDQAIGNLETYQWVVSRV